MHDDAKPLKPYCAHSCDPEYTKVAQLELPCMQEESTDYARE